MPAPKLHVIYAGRGDAMILECDDPASPQNRIFILVDGGPKNYHSGKVAGTAPYHRHLWSACQRLMGSDGGLSGIIISHPDEDHFGGFVHALAEAKKKLPKKTSVFLPNDKYSSENAKAPIQKICDNAGLQIGVLKPQLIPQSPYLIGPVRAIFPKRQRILWYHDPNAQADTDFQYNSALSKNGRSILMVTDTGQPTEMGIFFTGDNDADTISREMKLYFKAPKKARFAIYKIQHHGSIYDNMMDFYNPLFYEDLGATAMVYSLLKARHFIAFIANPERTGPSVSYAAKVMTKVLLKHYGYNGETKIDAYEKQVGDLMVKVQKGQLDTLGPKPGHGEEETKIFLPDAGHPLDPDPETLLEDLDTALKRDPNMPNRAEWTKYRSNTTAELMTYLFVRSVKKFYMTFEADVYVVSANFKYNHPRCETIFGLALAVKEQKRKARLYLTNGQSLDIEGLYHIASIMESESVIDLFHGDHLRVSFLRGDSFMSLDGSSQGWNSDMVNVDRDLNNMTEEINFSLVQEDSITELHRRLEQKDKDEVIRAKECYLQFFSSDGSLWYLSQYHHDNGTIVWKATDKNHPETTFIDDSDWLKNLPQDQTPLVKCRADKYDIPFDEFLVIRDGENHENEPQWIFMDAEKTSAFYFRNGLVVFGHFEGEEPIRLSISPLLPHLQSMAGSLEARIPAPISITEYETSPLAPLNLKIQTSNMNLDCSLRKAFELVGDPVIYQESPNIIETLSCLFQGKALLGNTLKRIPDSILRAGFADFTTDLDESKAKVIVLPFGGYAITRAVISRPKSPNQKDDGIPIKMAGLGFSLKEVVVTVEDCQTSRVVLSIECRAFLKEAEFELKMRWKSSEAETIISFSSSTIGIKNLIGALVGKGTNVDEVLEGEVPLMNKGSGGESTSSVGTVIDSIREVGFSLRQPIEMVCSYELAEIGMRTDFQDWKSFLPKSERFLKIKGDVLLQLQNPLSPKSRRIGATVELTLPIPGKDDKSVTAHFCAAPLPREGDYDYRFRIFDVGRGVTIPDIASAIGLDGVSNKINEVPILKSAFETILIREVGVSVDRVDGEWQFQEWAFDVSIPILQLIPGSLALADARLRVEKFQDGELRARGEATFKSQKLQKEAEVGLAIPTRNEPGYITFSAPDGLTLADVFTIFKLGDLSDVPFLGGEGAVCLTHCEVHLKIPEKEDKMVVSSFSARLHMNTFEIGDFTMKDTDFSLSWQRGGEVQEGGNTTASAFNFELRAELQKISSVISLKYEGEKKELSASITPLKDSPIKVADVLTLLIPGADSALHSTFRELKMKVVEMSLDLKTGSPSAFKLEFDDDSRLLLPSATKSESFSLNSVRIEYAKIANKLEVFASFNIGSIQTSISLATLIDSTSDERSVQFSILVQKGQKDLGLFDFLAAVGIKNPEIPRPEGCPEFSLGMASIKGKFVDKGKSGLKFSQLSVHVELAGFLMSDWDIALDKLFVDVEYNKARSDKPFLALVSGKLIVADSAEMTINYIDVKDVLELQAKLSPREHAEVRVGSILQWLTGDSTEESLPSFISEAVIDFKAAKFDMSLSRRKAEGNSTVIVSLSFALGSVGVQLARTRVRPDAAKKNDKLPWKTLLRFAVNTLPRPPPLPLVGQMEQPFSTQIYWTNSDISLEEVDKLNGLVTFKDQQLLRSDRATAGSAFGQGLSFMLLNNGDIVLASKPRKSKKKDGPSGKMMVVLEEEENPEAQEMKRFDKRVNGVAITNVGLDYDAKGQKIKVKFTARMTVGPMDGELINFSMIVTLPQSKRIELKDWKNLDIDMGLDGLSLAMTGSNLNVAGALHRIKVEGEDISITGFEGGVSVKLKKYQFVGFGSYKRVKTKQEEFVSLMAYAMLKGTMVKTGLVELSGISGGFGLGSKLEIPAITEIHKFPLLIDPDADPMVMFERLRGTGDTKYMTETNGANWVAAGVLGTACELIDVRAVLTIPLDPSAGELAIVGTASAQFPRDAKPGKALAAIKINFQGSIDMSRGSMLFQGRIADGSFILFDDCVLTGGFAVGAWFGTSPQAGDWCISIGGWHPAYQPPDHYPKGLPRMGLSWTYGKDKCLSLSGQAYAAVTPEALMGGLAVRVKYEKWSCGAEFDFRTDLILYLHPLHYNAKFHVHASLWYELDAWVLRKKFTKSLGADLTISGPPFGGVVEFKLTVITIRVKFGEHQSKPDRLDFGDFMTVVLKNAETDHVFALESGAMTLEKVPAEAQTPKSSWIVRGGSLAFSITSRVPTTSIEFEGAQDPKRQLGGRIFARPMQLFSSSSGLTANIKASVHKINTNGEDLSEGFFFEVLREQLPASLWGSYDGNTDAMLGGTSRESTVTHATGLRIEAPLSKWSTLNPQIILFSDLWKIKPVTTQFATDQARDVAFDAEPRSNKDNEESDFAQARKALIGTDQMTEEENAAKARNTRRASVMSQWASIRKLKTSASLRSNLPLRYAKGLVSFSHVAPRISVE
jgi:hypothetical protein